MSKAITIFTLVLAFIGGFLIFYNPKPVSGPTEDNSEAIQKWESKIDDQASVTVTVTPSNLLLESNEWKFDVVMSTHSVELDKDMTQVTILVDDAGNEYKPLRWEGAPAGGHHREGVLIFAQITPYPQQLKLIIKDVGGIQRLFLWTLVR
ncbi:MAG: hypothetical protein Q8Q18_02425 [bacterium]|nr:hypothetical protein [bacterium]